MMNYHLVLMKSNVLIPRSRGRSVTSPPRSSTSPSMRSTSTRGSARTFTGNYFKFCKGCPISRRTSVGLTENTPILRTNSTYNSDKGEGGFKKCSGQLKDPKSSISAEGRNCRNRTFLSESAFLRTKVVSFCRKRSNISAEIAVFWPKLSISAVRALLSEKEILPKCFGTNRNQQFWPKAERERFRLT